MQVLIPTMVWNFTNISAKYHRLVTVEVRNGMETSNEGEILEKNVMYRPKIANLSAWT